jgi:hypothetical protein
MSHVTGSKFKVVGRTGSVRDSTVRISTTYFAANKREGSRARAERSEVGSRHGLLLLKREVIKAASSISNRNFPSWKSVVHTEVNICS